MFPFDGLPDAAPTYDEATQRFFSRNFALPEGYPEYATDAYRSPHVDKFTYAPLDHEGPDVIGPAKTYGTGRGRYLTVHERNPKNYYQQTGLKVRYPFDQKNPDNPLNQSNVYEAPIVKYPISNRAYLMPQYMPYDVSPAPRGVRQVVEDLVRQLMEGR